MYHAKVSNYSKILWNYWTCQSMKVEFNTHQIYGIPGLGNVLIWAASGFQSL